VSFKTDIELRIQGLNKLTSLRKEIKVTSELIEEENKLLKEQDGRLLAITNSTSGYSKVLREASKNLNQVVAGSNKEAIAIKELVTAMDQANTARARQNKLVRDEINIRRGINSSMDQADQYKRPIGPRLLAGQTSSIAKDGTGTLVGQRVNVEERIKTILGEQDSLQKSLLELEKKSTTELAEKAKLRAKNKQQFQSEVQALANQANVEKAAMQAEVEATKNIVAEEIKRREAGKLSGIQRRQNMEMANQELLTEIKLTKLAEKKARGQKFKGAIGSGLIGGAFPLLFGQGLGASVGGAAGGFGGGLMGGQFGFALSLVGTTVGAQFDKLAQSARQLGEALKNPIENMDMLITKMGQANTPFGNTVKTLKSLGLEAVAAGQVLDNFNKTFGTNKTSLAQLGEESIRFNNELEKLGTSITLLVAGPLTKFLEVVNDTLGNKTIKGIRRESDLEAFNLGMKKFAPNTPKALANLGAKQNFFGKTVDGQTFNEFRKGIAPGIFNRRMNEAGLGGQAGTTNNADVNLQRIIKERRDFELSTMKSQLMIEKKSLTMRSEDVNVLKRRIDLLKIEEQLKVKGLADTEIMSEEQERAHQFAIDKLKIEKQISEELLNQSIIMADPMQAALIDLNKQMANFNNITFQTVEFSKAFGDAFSESFKGIIRGTMSVQEAFANMFNRIADHFADMAAKMAATRLQQGILSMFANSFGGGSYGNIVPDTSTSFSTSQAFSAPIKYASGGYVTSPTVGLVGEAGENEYVIPASKMASSMQRYSAGARGDSVVAGGGSSYAGGGGGSSTTVNYSGPILTFNSEEFVPKSAVNDIISTAARQGASQGSSQTFATLRNSRSARSRIGL